MSNNRFKWDGLDELRAELRHLPAAMRADAEGIVLSAAEHAAEDVEDGYPAGAAGELGAKVKVKRESGGAAFAGAMVVNTSKLAFIYEIGTQARHNALGENRGVMHPGNVFIPAMIKWRAVMYDQLRAMMRGKGLSVSG